MMGLMNTEKKYIPLLLWFFDCTLLSYWWAFHFGLIVLNLYM